jgi:hypothetical protein
VSWLVPKILENGTGKPRREFLCGFVAARAGKRSFDFAGMFVAEHSCLAQDDNSKLGTEKLGAKS